MRTRFITFCCVAIFTCMIFVIAVVLAGKGLADDIAGDQARPAVEIVLDQASKSFRFIIEGREVARIDEQGLRVRASVEYGGTITDIGTVNYDAPSDQ